MRAAKGRRHLTNKNILFRKVRNIETGKKGEEKPEQMHLFLIRFQLKTMTCVVSECHSLSGKILLKVG